MYLSNVARHVLTYMMDKMLHIPDTSVNSFIALKTISFNAEMLFIDNNVLS